MYLVIISCHFHILQYRKGKTYCIINHKHYHLLEQFIDMNADSDELHQPTATLCATCYNSVTKEGKPTRPKLSIANGVDFGLPQRIGLPPLTLAEEILLGNGYELATIIKLTGWQTNEKQAALKGHIITVRKSKEALIRELDRIEKSKLVLPRPETITETLSVVILGAKVSFASLQPTAYNYASIQVRSTVLYEWLRAKKALDPHYKDIEIDDSKEMTERLIAIPKLLIDAAGYVEDEKALAAEKTIEQIAKGNAFVHYLNFQMTNNCKIPRNWKSSPNSYLHLFLTIIHITGHSGSRTSRPEVEDHAGNEESVFLTRTHPDAPTEAAAAQQSLSSNRPTKKIEPKNENEQSANLIVYYTRYCKSSIE